MPNFHPSYRPDIDGLRAIAVCAVVIFHAFPTLVPGGFVGVDIFFVISGYLITSIILRSLETGNFSLSDFYARRIRRIFPTLIVVLGTSYTAGWWLLNAEEFKLLGKHIAAGAGFVQNAILEREADYFDTASTLKPLMHLWSLSVEEQFYLLFPALLWFFWRIRVNLKYSLVALLLLSFTLNVANVHEYPTTVFFAPQTRFWELWVGGALTLFKVNGVSAKQHSWASWLGIALISFSFFGLSEESVFPGAWAAMPVLGAAVLIHSGQNPATTIGGISHPWMVRIGLISYPLYLWHWPLLSFLRIVEEGEPAWPWRVLVIALSVLLAWTTFRWIERPLRFTNHKVVVAGLVAALATVGVLGYETFRHDGLGQRYPQLAQSAPLPPTLATVLDPVATCRKLLPQFGAMENCDATSSSILPKVVLVGDSHSAHTFPGLAAILPPSIPLVNLGCGGCLPLHGITGSAGVQSRKKSDQMEHILAWVAQTPEIEVVILAARGPMYISGKGFGETRKNIHLQLLDQPTIRDPEEVFAIALRNTLQYFISAGKKVIVTLDVAELGFDPKACLNTRPIRFHASARQSVCAVSRYDVDMRNARYRSLVQEVARDYPHATVFDAAAPFCDTQWCWGIRDGVRYYSDNNHLTVEGSHTLAQTLAPAVQRLLRNPTQP